MDFVAVERFGRPNSFGRENFGRGRALFPGSTGTVGPFRYKISADRGFFPGSCVSRERFLSRNRVNPAEHGQMRIARPKLLLRVRGQCFGADCVFTPFSPSILS
ncbi:unnamed protein product [Microthlaspi erraticum]|uniref:Uncharacterized protein n=1 Tax=Microthlaspi erraticum TaxID=1685480 RepID=A0A6D2I0D9_9BRAS|nr:unnamed protein product [Microthlaspi erraticum]